MLTVHFFLGDEASTNVCLSSLKSLTTFIRFVLTEIPTSAVNNDDLGFNDTHVESVEVCK